MATNIQSHALIVIQGNRNSGASSSLFRVAVPMLYAAMGVSLGTLTGVTTALMSGRINASSATSDAASLRPAAAVPSASGVAEAGIGGFVEKAAVVYHVGAFSDAAAQNHSAAARPGLNSPLDHGKAGAENGPVMNLEPAKVPAIDTKSVHPPASVERTPTRRLAHPVTRPARRILASVPEVAPVPMDEQLSFVAAATSNFYSEGDVMVADYNATVGTIETSDGKTFALGETVTATNATPWNEYRSNLHYRCGESGSCVLQRAGAVAANARQI